MDTYKKKYKELVAWINLLSHSALTIDQHKIVDVILERSEKLAESEDERIRKELLEFLDELSKLGKNTNFDRWSKSDCADWICWLKKQGEQILANSAKTCKDEQEPTDEEMKTLLRIEYEKGRADAIAEMQKPVDCIDCTNSKGCINCEDGNMKETLVQNPAWSEEDEEFLRRAINATKDAYPITAKWLKFLKGRVQSKQEWNEEDDLILETIIDHIIPDKPFIANGFTDEELVTWLKSLRHKNKYDYNPYKAVVESIAEMCKHYDKASHSGLRDFYDNVKVKCKDAKEYDNMYSHNTWKPSEEQIKAIRLARSFVTDDFGEHNTLLEILIELEAQLKELK